MRLLYNIIFSKMKRSRTTLDPLNRLITRSANISELESPAYFCLSTWRGPCFLFSVPPHPPLCQHLLLIIPLLSLSAQTTTDRPWVREPLEQNVCDQTSILKWCKDNGILCTARAKHIVPNGHGGVGAVLEASMLFWSLITLCCMIHPYSKPWFAGICLHSGMHPCWCWVRKFTAMTRHKWSTGSFSLKMCQLHRLSLIHWKLINVPLS